MLEFNVDKHDIFKLGAACFKLETLVIKNLLVLDPDTPCLFSFNSNKIIENLCNSILANIESRVEIKFFKYKAQSPSLTLSSRNDADRSG